MGGDLTLEPVPGAEALAALGLPPSPHTPRKDLWYLQRRYFAFPYFRYDVWAAREQGRLLAYAVTRTVSAADTGCAPVLRLVDFIGADEVLPRLGRRWMRFCSAAEPNISTAITPGSPRPFWQAAGLRERLPGDGVVIPNYLTPPLHDNTEYFYFTNRPENFVLFKADGDQDRPNLG